MSNKIVFLDALTVDQGDIDFSPISNFGDFIPYDYTSPEETAARINDASIVITNKIEINKSVLDDCKNIKFIAVAATGYNNIDLGETGKRGISVSNVPGYSTWSVAQLTLTFILTLASNLIKYNNSTFNGSWSKSPVNTLGNWPVFDLREKTIAILGMGAIGKEVAKLCKVFGMKIIALKREGMDYNDGLERYNLDTIAQKADFISIHMPLTDYSKHLINSDFLKKMKNSAFLINMARGSIVDPHALLSALKNKEIAGAAIDVMEKEPPDKDDPLFDAPNIIITPHIAWSSIESRKRLICEIAANIEAFTRGEKRNLVYK